MKNVIGLVAMATVVLSACGGEAKAAAEDRTASSVELTGNIIEIGMFGVGETYFGPDEVTAKRGDVLRFKLESGVHNVEFPAAQNPAGVALPDVSPYLQAPGQTWDYTVDLPVGEYTYQCTPHAALGMIGKLIVTE